MPVDKVVWGDVRVEVFRHKKQCPKSPRQLIFFTVFNTNMHSGKSEITFEKLWVDKLHKDRKHKLLEESFYITMKLSRDEQDSEWMRTEKSFEEIFKAAAVLKTFRKGDVVISEDEKRRQLVLIESGDVEGVNYGPKHEVHPLGRSIAEAYAVSGTRQDLLLPPATSSLLRFAMRHVWRLPVHLEH
jgi:hypothetical protein